MSGRASPVNLTYVRRRSRRHEWLLTQARRYPVAQAEGWFQGEGLGLTDTESGTIEQSKIAPRRTEPLERVNYLHMYFVTFLPKI